MADRGMRLPKAYEPQLNRLSRWAGLGRGPLGRAGRAWGRAAYSLS